MVMVLDSELKTLLGGSWDLVSMVTSALAGNIFNCNYSFYSTSYNL